MTLLPTITEFTCIKCNKHIVHRNSLTTGYGINDKDEKVCYSCCAEDDKAFMQSKGKITLYLSWKGQPTIVGNTYNYRPPMWIYPESAKVGNWPGSLSIPIRSIKVGRHNMAGVRYDVWFKFNNENWHGVQYGNFTQICHCKRVKA